MGDEHDLDGAIRRADLDELLRLIEGLCAMRDWDALAALRERCARAQESGRQLWPVASHAAYRLALEAPAPWSAAVLVDDATTFALGPLPEVAAQAHAWHDLAPHVRAGAAAVLAAHERVVRGEDLSGIELPGPAVLELPQRLTEWEPRYVLAEYEAHTADFPAPRLPAFGSVTLPDAPRRVERDEACVALVDLVRAWTTRSDGRADAVAVTGDALAAIAGLGVHRARVAALGPDDSLALMAWAGASGGAHGRRPGAAAGRFAAWWVAGALTGLLEDWPPEPEQLGAAWSALRFFAWDAGEPATGWQLHLAVEDPSRGQAWAMAAVDAR